MKKFYQAPSVVFSKLSNVCMLVESKDNDGDDIDWGELLS